MEDKVRMNIQDSVVDRIFYNIDRDELAQLAVDLTNIDSPTGREQEIANFIVNWFDENGFRTVKQEIESGRFNAIGIMPGTQQGSSLTLNGHLDIVATTQPIRSAYVNDGKVYGNEVANMKAGLATIMSAAKAIKKAGVELKGDLIVATVAGEISVAPVDPFQEPQDRGEGVGTRHLLANGIQSDYAIVADCSEYAIVRAQAGVAYFKISTTGVQLYAPFTQRTDKVEATQNSIIKMAEVICELENWSRDYERKSIYSFPGGRVEPKSVITVLAAGMPRLLRDGWREPFNPSQTPPFCNLYMDIRLPPGVTPMEVKHNLEEFLAKLPFELSIEMFRSQRGYEGKGEKVDHLYSTIEKAYEHVFQKKPPPAPAGVSSIWTDTNLYWEIGIPAVKWGPSEIVKYPDMGTASIEGLVKAAKVYGLVVLDICGYI
ncbi:M20 family metallopeptidase [Chloroflexota bacterium]